MNQEIEKPLHKSGSKKDVWITQRGKVLDTKQSGCTNDSDGHSVSDVIVTIPANRRALIYFIFWWFKAAHRAQILRVNVAI
jgi:hypothetical protein